jgi:hypothetical protein
VITHLALQKKAKKIRRGIARAPLQIAIVTSRRLARAHIVSIMPDDLIAMGFSTRTDIHKTLLKILGSSLLIASGSRS